MIDKLHELEFTIGPFGVRHILEGPRQLLDGHVLLRHRVVSRAGNNTTLHINSDLVYVVANTKLYMDT